MTNGFLLAEDLTASMVALTTVKWKQRPGVKSEPLESAWKRIFRRPKPLVPVWFSHCVYEGRTIVAHFFPLGRLVTYDANGATIRVVNKRAVDVAANMGVELRAYDPLTAHYQSHGRPVMTRNASTHHGRVAGATESFLTENGA